MEYQLNNYQFEKPVIIVAAPRSGSTLLFEQLAKSEDFWTIGIESHQFIENIPEFNVTAGKCDSNRLTKENATLENISHLRGSFYQSLRNNNGVMFDPKINHFKPRFLEKTPKNTLRISLLNEVFPDAQFIYLYRNPRENLSSIIDAWQSKNFQTYLNLPGRDTSWSLLLPEGWQDFHNAAVEELAVFQWNKANQAVIDDLSKIEKHRWTSLSYQQLVNNPQQTLRDLCEFAGVSAAGLIDTNRMALSRYTLTQPSKNKWHKNAKLLKPIIGAVEETLANMATFLPDFQQSDLDISIDDSALRNTFKTGARLQATDTNKLSRNSPCHCGSALKYKHCCGKLS